MKRYNYEVERFNIKIQNIYNRNNWSRKSLWILKEIIASILDEKVEYLKLEIHEELLFINDYGIVIRIKNGSLKESED